jgi:glycosyltransferase involved in cell wall biosynthesis
MSNSPTISVITPCYNAESYIEEAINSVLSQSYDNIEHIVVDGGSSDGTFDILDQYSTVEYISEPDRGLYDALNKGIALADGDFIGWLNADDIYTRSAFNAFVEAYRESPAVDVIVGHSDVFRDEKGERTTIQEYRFTDPDDLSKGRITHTSFGLNGCLISADLIDSIDDFNSSYKIAGDGEYLIRIAAAKPHCTGVSEVVYRYRSHDGSLTFSENKADAVTNLGSEEMVDFLPKYIIDPTVPEELRSYCKLKYRQRCGLLLQYYLSQRDISASIGLLRDIATVDRGWFSWAVRKVVTKTVVRM